MFNRTENNKTVNVPAVTTMIMLALLLGQASVVFAERLAFIPTEDGGYRFDTGILKGTLRAGGKSLGLGALTHVPTGVKLTGSSAGIMSHYRVFSRNHRYGPAAWGWPSRAKPLADGAVQAYWPSGEDRPFDMTVVYRWHTADTLDVETTVKAYKRLPAFESFLASYFDKDFPASKVYARVGPVRDFARTDRTFGDWQMFPRDPMAVKLIQDGRWKQPPHPVDWAIGPRLGLPMGIRRHTQSDLCVVVMSPVEDCFAVSTPYAGEGHFSLYLSLGGQSIEAGDTVTMRSRLVVIDAPTDPQIRELYSVYMEDLASQSAAASSTSCADWPFYALCMDTHDAKKRNLAQQADMLKALGYAGCAHLWLDDLETRVSTLTRAGLRLFQVYVRVDLSKAQPLDFKRMAEILPLLKPHNTQLALLVTGGAPSDQALDGRAVEVVEQLADLALPHDVEIVLYPHSNDWLETCADAVRIAKKINRPDQVGAMFNLCHWMKADANRDLRAVLTEAAPWLMAVSLSGSDRPDQIRAGQGNWIQPLGKGSYDIEKFLTILQDIGYAKPVGLQCYGIGGDAQIHLKQSISSWNTLCDRLD